MIHDVVAARSKGGYKIELTFDNGRSGVVDFSRYAEKGGVFRPFRDLAFFQKFRINSELGVLEWDNHIDVAPETLYAGATGDPLPHWMQKDDPKTA